MKKTLFTFILVLFTSNAFAVKVADCPTAIKFKYSDVSLSSIDKIYEIYAYNQAMDVKDIEEDDKVILQEVVKKINTLGLVSGEWPRTKASNGRCAYSAGGFDGVEIYTTKGKDTLLAEIELDAVKNEYGTKFVVVRVYAKIEALSSNSIQVAANQGLAIGIPRGGYERYDAGGPLIFIGKIRDFSAEAK